MKHVFSNREAIKTGWELFKANWKFIIVLGIGTTFAQIFVKAVQQGLGDRNPLLAGIVGLIAALITIIIGLGWSKVTLALVRGHHAGYETFRTEPSVWLQSIKATLWLILYILRNTLVVIIPGAILAGIGFGMDIEWLSIVGVVLGVTAGVLMMIYMSTKYQFLTYTVLDYPNEKSKNVFRKTGALTDGVWWKLFGFSVVTGLVTLAGLLCLLVGLVAAIPTVMLAKTKVYEILKNRHETGSVSSNE